MNVSHSVDERSCNHCGSGIAINITYTECVFMAQIIQHAMLMHRVILSFGSCSGPQMFSTLPYKWHDFREGGGG